MWKLLTKSSHIMERIHKNKAGLFTVLILILELSQVYSADVTTSNKDAIYGPNPVSVTCSYTLVQNETFLSMTISRKSGNNPFGDLAIFQNNQGFYRNQPQAFQDRTTLILQGGSASIDYQRVECEDDATYRCQFAYGDNSVSSVISKEMKLTVQVKPGQPSFSPSNINTMILNEGQELDLQCRGMVGNPAGDYKWFAYFPNGEAIDLTSATQPGTPYPTPSDCSYQRVGVLNRSLTRADNELVIRCTVNHVTLGNPPTSASACIPTSCIQTEKLTVHYPVRREDVAISRLPMASEYLIGSEVTLTCTGNGNPPATFLWQKDGDENTTMASSKWMLSNLQISDSGTYMCTASNTVNNILYNVSKSVNIQVVATTTPPPTTTPLSTTPEDTTPKTGPVVSTLAPAAANIGVWIAVGVVAAVIVIALIIVGIFLYWRKGKKNGAVEEPPEKPYNNHNLSMYNTKPDLVTNDEKKQNYYNKDDALAYADLKFDDKPRSRRPVALADSMTDYADIRMPQV